MKKLLAGFAVVAVSLFMLASCGDPQKPEGFVYCCVKQADGTKKCIPMGPGDCKNAGTALSSCGDCK